MRVPHQHPHTEMTDTWAFYDRQAAQYAEATLSQSMERWLSPFTARLPARAPVVDLGCGAGRDLKFLRAAGFAAVGLDRSEPLARIAGRHSNAPVVVGDLRCVPFADSVFAGAWAAASLLHLPRPLIAIALAEAYRVLRSGSVLFVSVKHGRGVIRDRSGRFFTLFELDELRAALIAAGFRPLDMTLSEPDSVETNRGTGRWISCLATRT